MNFGRYADMTVQQIIDMHRECYLIWVYCNMSNISFNKDILDYLNVPENHRVDFGDKLKGEHYFIEKFYWGKLKGELSAEEYDILKIKQWRLTQSSKKRVRQKFDREIKAHQSGGIVSLSKKSKQ